MSHLKSLRTSKIWPIKRKVTKFTTRPSPGTRRIEDAVSLNFVLRDMLDLTKTMRETKKVLQQKTVLVNGVVRTDHRFPVGVLDTIDIQPSKEQYIILFSTSGKLMAKKVKTPLSGRLAQVVNKTMLKGKKVQLNFHDGTNIILDKNGYNTSDTVMIEKNKITKHVKFEKGATAYLVGGKHKGKTATIVEVKLMSDMQKHRIVFTVDKESFETLKEYAFIIEKPFALA